MGDWHLFGHRGRQRFGQAEYLESLTKTGLDVGLAEPVDSGLYVHDLRAALAVWVGTAMSFLLSAVGLIFCAVLFFSGYAIPVIVGGIAGSFFGVAGFGGAISGAIPGAIAGAVIAIALKK